MNQKIWGMKETFIIVIGVLVLLAISLTVIKHNQNNASSTGKINGYIYHDSKNVLFLKFTNKDGILNGSYYSRWEDPNNQLRTYDSPFTGQIEGNTISITFKVTGNSFTGNVSDGEIDMAVPQKDGTVATFKFKPGTLNDFNKYVSEIKSSVSNDQQAAQQAQQTADLNKQLSDVESKINKEMQTIQESDTQTLQSDVQSTGKDFDAEKKDMDALKQDYNTAISSGAISDANQVRSDANLIQADDNQINSDNNGFQNHVQNLQNELTTFQTDVQNMNDLASQLGQSLPEYLPKQSDVEDIVNKANSIIKSTTETMNGYVTSSKQMVDSANDLANKAHNHANQY